MVLKSTARVAVQWHKQYSMTCGYAFFFWWHMFNSHSIIYFLHSPVEYLSMFPFTVNIKEWWTRKKNSLSENQTCVTEKKCITTCHTVPLMPLYHDSGCWLKYHIKALILHMPRHQLYSLGHAPPSWVGLGKWPHGLTLKITLCDVCTTCSNLAWECHVWQVMPVIYKIKRSAKLQINLRKLVNDWGGVW